jgi:polyhydroxyalkanoate synthesis regulator protein
MMEEQARRNMQMFEKAFGMFAPFARSAAAGGEKSAEPSGDIDELKRQLDEMQKRLSKLADKKD